MMSKGGSHGDQQPRYEEFHQWTDIQLLLSHELSEHMTVNAAGSETCPHACFHPWEAHREAPV